MKEFLNVLKDIYETVAQAQRGGQNLKQEGRRDAGLSIKGKIGKKITYFVVN